jgi:hypothetical protein
MTARPPTACGPDDYTVSAASDRVDPTLEVPLGAKDLQQLVCGQISSGVATSSSDAEQQQRGASSTAKRVPEHCGEQNACYKFSAAMI